MSDNESSVNFMKDGLYGRLLSSIDQEFELKGCPPGLVKLAYDDHFYWHPEDVGRYEQLFGQWCELMIRNTHGLSDE